MVLTNVQEGLQQRQTAWCGVVGESRAVRGGPGGAAQRWATHWRHAGCGCGCGCGVRVRMGEGTNYLKREEAWGERRGKLSSRDRGCTTGALGARGGLPEVWLRAGRCVCEGHARGAVVSGLRASRHLTNRGVVVPMRHAACHATRQQARRQPQAPAPPVGRCPPGLGRAVGLRLPATRSGVPSPRSSLPRPTPAPR